MVALTHFAGTDLGAVRGGWDVDDVLLYHLAIGAGADPVDPAELRYAYEADLLVLPSFPSAAALGGVLPVLADEVGLDMTAVLHGTQAVELPGPLPVAADVVHRSRIDGVHDKGSGALMELTVVTEAIGGAVLATSRYGIFVRGAGGWDGARRRSDRIPPPDRAPDAVVQTPTLPQQALLYRLAGDRNPLHADPGFARRSGLDRPILHGLCRFGMAVKAAVQDPGRVTGVGARFASPVVPGETITTRLWREPDRTRFATHVGEREVLSDGWVDHAS